MYPSAGAHGIGHVINDAMVSVLSGASTAMQSAVFAFESLISPNFSFFCDLVSTELSFPSCNNTGGVFCVWRQAILFQTTNEDNDKVATSFFQQSGVRGFSVLVGFCGHFDTLHCLVYVPERCTMLHGW